MFKLLTNFLDIVQKSMIQDSGINKASTALNGDEFRVKFPFDQPTTPWSK